jgi:hypothetical protein
MRISHLVLAVLLATPAITSAQLRFNRFDSIPVSEQGNTLRWAWAGGLNHPQFNNIDLDGDGTLDLILLDKSGDKTLAFKRGSGAGVDAWDLAPRYRDMFINQHSGRERPHDWLLTRDFNCDGKQDVFTYSNGGLAVYRNASASNIDTLIFELMTPLLLSDYGNGPINIYVSPVDLPAIDDFDKDGDIDIVTFSLQGMFAEFHKNLSKELYGHCDSLVFELADACWGSFAEDPSTVFVSLNQSCKGNVGTEEHSAEAGGARHSGFTLLAIDIDGDEDKDMVLSNVSYPKLNLLTNGGDLFTASITAQDTQFPMHTQSSIEVNIDNFPAAFAADVNNDGRTDLIASPYQENNGRNNDGVWLYADDATAGAKDYAFVRNNFLQHGMMEFGTGAYPALADVSGDGLLDLLVGNYGYFAGTGTYQRRLAYYRNVGTATAPSFALVTRDYASLSQITLTNVAPTFGDLDGDGDLDMLVGDGTGDIHFFRNNASGTTEAQYTLAAPGYQGINVGQVATPQLVDVNGDGLLDLIIGRNNGTLSYWRNSGTALNAVFTLEDAQFGGVITRAPGVSYGYSAPFFFNDGSELKAFVGAENGVLHHFTGITETIAGPDVITAEVGAGNATSSSPEQTPFGFSKRSGRHQFIIRAEELNAAGLSAGLITRIGLDVANATPFQVAQINIGIKNTMAQSVSGFEDGTVNIYSQQADTVFQGYNDFVCQNPQPWDGVSNLLVQVCFYHVQNNGAMPDFQVMGSATPFNSHAYATATTTSGCNISYVGNGTFRPDFTFGIKPTFPSGGRLPMYEGERLTVHGADLNSDGYLDLVMGNLAGGLSFYKGGTTGITPNAVPTVQTTATATHFTVFPNPTSNQLNIRCDKADIGSFSIALFDLTGRELVRQQISGPMGTIDLGSLPSGTYLLRTMTGSLQQHTRVVVQH